MAEFDWHDAENAETPHCAVYEADAHGDERERVADFYGPKAAKRAEAYCALLNAHPFNAD